ncbi:unnamed protein product [Brassica napus]|uniref:(rape) hypothetical protein n=1 Tax=Brassica napus TaxID=3708 RepID=A0A816RYR6_BRANA|nr:unnamed protein product [Brassica napus]
MVQRLIVGIHQHHHVKETTPTGSVFFVACNYVSGLQLEGMSLTRMLNLDQLVPTKNLPTMILMNNDFNGLMPQNVLANIASRGNNSFFFANANRSSAEGAVAIIEAEDAATVSQTFEAENAATISQTVEAEYASMHQAVDTNNDHKVL